MTARVKKTMKKELKEFRETFTKTMQEYDIRLLEYIILEERNKKQRKDKK